ncbi:MAG: hypothetical protein SGCHY_002514 [Lobulomycetales sp.]
MSAEYDEINGKSSSDDDHWPVKGTADSLCPELQSITGMAMSPPDAKRLRRLQLAVLICLVFFLVELAGGLWTNSLALLGDSMHLLTDCVTYAVSLFAIYIGQRPPTPRFSLGFARAEVLGALVSLALIWTCTLLLLSSAFTKLVSPSPEPINAGAMFALALVGLLVNLVLLTLFHDPHHPTTTTTTTLDQDVEAGAKLADSINIRAAILHAVGDLICSLGVLAASVVVMLRPDWKIVDPLCTLFFASIVMCTTFPVARDVVLILMQGTPACIDRSALENMVAEMDGVAAVNWLHVSSLNLEKHVLSLCVLLDKARIDDVTARKRIHELLDTEFPALDMALCTIQTD